MAADTRAHRDALYGFLLESDPAAVGALFTEYLLEAQHGCWEGFQDRRTYRVIQELLADIDRYRQYTDPTDLADRHQMYRR